MALSVGVSHGKLTPSLVWRPWVFHKWGCNVFSLSRDLTRPPHFEVMRIYGWELPALCHHPEKFGDHTHCDTGDAMFLICHVISRDHMFTGLYKVMSGSPVRPVTILACLLQVEIFHMTLLNLVISFHFISLTLFSVGLTNSYSS